MTHWISYAVLLPVVGFLLQSAPALAQVGESTFAGVPGLAPDFDWVQHTQRTLDELKRKLNLAPDQAASWETWSGGVLMDARRHIEQAGTRGARHRQVGQRMARPEGNLDRSESPLDATTPELMARGIQKLREQTNWMQANLVQLEAAQSRTSIFYSTLTTNQKTIFDLFWHEMHHRVSGQDDVWHTGEEEDSTPDAAYRE